MFCRICGKKDAKINKKYIKEFYSMYIAEIICDGHSHIRLIQEDEKDELLKTILEKVNEKRS